MKRAIYLSGGGARGAYQAGVLKGIQEILGAKQLPAQILSSVSVGSINAAFLAMKATTFESAVKDLADLWSSLSCDKVFRTGNLSLIKSIIRNMASTMFHYQPKKGGYLLDTSPLKSMLEKHLNFDTINKNIADGLVDFEVAATRYGTAETISFINSSQDISCWRRIRHQAYRQKIQCHHIMASSAFPLFFPSIKIDESHYGDGGIRLSSPLRAAIKMGATDILIIGTRASRLPGSTNTKAYSEGVSFASILGNMLNALFLDNLDRDLEFLAKINDSLRLISPNNIDKSKWRYINTLCIRPSIDIGQLAIGKQHILPLFLRYLMRAFGSKIQSGDFLSFLLFESAFCNILIELGYNDCLKQKDDILKFFERN